MDVKSHFAVSVLAQTITFLAATSAAPGGAAAAPAVTTWTTYLYQGPGSRYAVVDEVPQGTQVDVADCASGWCRIELDRRTGYLSAEVVAKSDPSQAAPGLLPQPAASLVARPAGPCIEANQTGGNGGNARTIFCRK